MPPRPFFAIAEDANSDSTTETRSCGEKKVASGKDELRLPHCLPSPSAGSLALDMVERLQREVGGGQCRIIITGIINDKVRKYNGRGIKSG